MLHRVPDKVIGYFHVIQSPSSCSFTKKNSFFFWIYDLSFKEKKLILPHEIGRYEYQKGNAEVSQCLLPRLYSQSSGYLQLWEICQLGHK